MKKVKIMLTAITVFAVVGGALAFKAAKFNHTLYCSTEQLQVCPSISATTVEVAGAEYIGKSFCTDNPQAPCVDFTDIWKDN